MTQILSAAAARDHLRAGAELEDGPLNDLIVAAQGRIESFLNRSLVGNDGWPDADHVPAIVTHSVKLAVADVYRNREAPELTDAQLLPMIGRFQIVSFA